MKICLLGDTHFGVRNDSKVFHSFFEKFYKETFFPFLKKNKIDTVIQLGDLFDRRKYINYLSLTECLRYFFKPLKDNNITMHTLIGNHDIFWKEKLSVNSPDLLLKDFDNIHIHQSPTKIKLGELGIDMIPWICKENEKEVLDFVKNSKNKLCIGHFELDGFLLNPGTLNVGGRNSKFLKKYEKVFSGHFHTKSKKDNIEYLGTPYELFWNDYKDTKGFYVFDTKTLDTEFIKNENRIFYKFKYNDSKEDFDLNEFIKTINKLKDFYKDTYVKVIVVNKSNPKTFDKMMEEIYKLGPHDVSVVEDHTIDFLGDDSNIIDQAEDTVTIMTKYIDDLKIETNKDKIKNLVRELYIEALSTNTVSE